MIVHKFWRATRKIGNYTADAWLREGWFLFGFIPLYIRDRENRNAP
jgi:TRAP-type mannitol/chloroaromatic compound transport system permease small subunit